MPSPFPADWPHQRRVCACIICACCFIILSTCILAFYSQPIFVETWERGFLKGYTVGVMTLFRTCTVMSDWIVEKMFGNALFVVGKFGVDCMLFMRDVMGYYIPLPWRSIGALSTGAQVCVWFFGVTVPLCCCGPLAAKCAGGPLGCVAALFLTLPFGLIYYTLVFVIFALLVIAFVLLVWIFGTVVLLCLGAGFYLGVTVVAMVGLMTGLVVFSGHILYVLVLFAALLVASLIFAMPFALAAGRLYDWIKGLNLFAGSNAEESCSCFPSSRRHRDTDDVWRRDRELEGATRDNHACPMLLRAAWLRVRSFFRPDGPSNDDDGNSHDMEAQFELDRQLALRLHLEEAAAAAAAASAFAASRPMGRHRLLPLSTQLGFDNRPTPRRTSTSAASRSAIVAVPSYGDDIDLDGDEPSALEWLAHDGHHALMPEGPSPFPADGRDRVHHHEPALSGSRGGPATYRTHIAECAICMEEYDVRNGFTVEGCNHQCCTICIVRHVLSCLENIAERFPIRCPVAMSDGCVSQVSAASMRRLVGWSSAHRPALPGLAGRNDVEEDEEVVTFTRPHLNRLYRAEEEVRIPVGERVYCANPACARAARRLPQSDRATKWTCQHCRQVMCRACNLNRHTGTCESNRRMHAGRDEATASLIRRTSKPCPRCGVPITHYRGHACHHIRPGTGCPGCGTHFCFACLRIRRDEHTPHPSCRCLAFCDDTCGCIDCPDCAPGRPCGPACDGPHGGCRVCAIGLVD